MPGESYRRRLRSLLLCLSDLLRALINSLDCWFCTGTLGLILFQILSTSAYTLKHLQYACLCETTATFLLCNTNLSFEQFVISTEQLKEIVHPGLDVVLKVFWQVLKSKHRHLHSPLHFYNCTCKSSLSLHLQNKRHVNLNLSSTH